MDRVPVFIVTGFLGAGKSTHDLVRVGKTQVARTTTGCICCTIGSDIRSTLNELNRLADAGQATFSRVVVETTGLADPAPLVNDLLLGGSLDTNAHDVSAARFELAGIVTGRTQVLWPPKAPEADDPA